EKWRATSVRPRSGACTQSLADVCLTPTGGRSGRSANCCKGANTGLHPLTGCSMIAPVDNAESRLASHERHVVGNDRLGETLQGERANLFSRYASFESHVDTLAEQNLAVLGLAAEPCRHIAHGANRSVAGALGKSDLAQGRVTLGDANTKAQLATSLAPRGDQRRCSLAHRDCHLDRALGRVGDRHGVVEEDHDAIAGELVERPLK